MPPPIAVEKQGFGRNVGIAVESVASFFEVERDSGHHCYLLVLLVQYFIWRRRRCNRYSGSSQWKGENDGWTFSMDIAKYIKGVLTAVPFCNMYIIEI